MKVRATSELSEALAQSLAWRRKELTTTFLFLKTTKRTHERALLRRSAVPILYAHWEGFIKQAAQYYLELVARQNLRYEELKSCFVGISLRKLLHEFSNSRQTKAHIALVEFLTFNQGNSAKFPHTGVIDGESNLNSDVFRNILDTIGLPVDDYWTARLLLVDGSLLKTRNDIAHGEKVEVDDQTYQQLHKLVIDSLDYMRNCVENAAVRQLYRR